MEYDHDERQHSPSFRHKIKSTMFCFSYHYVEPAPSSSGSDDEEYRRSGSVSKTSSPSSWIRSKIRGRGFKRTSSTSEYRYDPMSYALNFDDESACIDEFPSRDFISRLQSSPSPTPRNGFSAIVRCS